MMPSMATRSTGPAAPVPPSLCCDGSRGLFDEASVCGLAATRVLRPCGHLLPADGRDSMMCPASSRPLPRNHRMDFPDLTPWFASPSDGYDELPSGDHETPYDE